VTRVPDFDELVGDDLGDEERERLERVHALLVEVGPPPELSPELAAGPNPFITLRAGRQRPRKRRAMLLLAATLALAAVFFGGYAAGNGAQGDESFTGARVIKLRATAAAPAALASLVIGKADRGGNWPMRLVADKLPPLPERGYYEVFLTRHGKPVAPCGSFVIHGGRGVAYLNAPYELEGAGWVVTIQRAGDRVPGRVVLST
jgi:hypothetical protein